MAQRSSQGHRAINGVDVPTGAAGPRSCAKGPLLRERRGSVGAHSNDAHPPRLRAEGSSVGGNDEGDPPSEAAAGRSTRPRAHVDASMQRKRHGHWICRALARTQGIGPSAAPAWAQRNYTPTPPRARSKQPRARPALAFSALASFQECQRHRFAHFPHRHLRKIKAV